MKETPFRWFAFLYSSSEATYLELLYNSEVTQRHDSATLLPAGRPAAAGRGAAVAGSGDGGRRDDGADSA